MEKNEKVADEIAGYFNCTKVPAHAHLQVYDNTDILKILDKAYPPTPTVDTVEPVGWIMTYWDVINKKEGYYLHKDRNSLENDVEYFERCSTYENIEVTNLYDSQAFSSREAKIEELKEKYKKMQLTQAHQRMRKNEANKQLAEKTKKLDEAGQLLERHKKYLLGYNYNIRLNDTNDFLATLKGDNNVG